MNTYDEILEFLKTTGYLIQFDGDDVIYVYQPENKVLYLKFVNNIHVQSQWCTVTTNWQILNMEFEAVYLFWDLI